MGGVGGGRREEDGEEKQDEEAPTPLGPTGWFSRLQMSFEGPVDFAKNTG